METENVNLKQDIENLKKESEKLIEIIKNKQIKEDLKQLETLEKKSELLDKLIQEEYANILIKSIIRLERKKREPVENVFYIETTTTELRIKNEYLEEEIKDIRKTKKALIKQY